MAPPRTQAVHQPGPEPLPEPLEALTRAFALLGTRGTGLVITALAKGPADLHLIHERVPGLSDGLLTRRLREMTALGLVARTDHPGTPAPTVYTLASHGKALLIPLAALTVWAQDHLPAKAPGEARPPQRDRAGAGRSGPSGRAKARGDSASSLAPTSTIDIHRTGIGKMSAHENVDLGHTVAGWTGTAVALVGFCVAGLGVIAVSAALVISGVAVIALAAVITWLLHLAGWGKPSGPRPADQWDWRVKDLGARQGHPDCLGCRMAGRRVKAVATSAQPTSVAATLPPPRQNPHSSGVQTAGPVEEGQPLL